MANEVTPAPDLPKIPYATDPNPGSGAFSQQRSQQQTAQKRVIKQKLARAGKAPTSQKTGPPP